MARVFISYRRADSAAFSGRIYDRLVARFGKRSIFKDVDDIPPGVDFAGYIQQALRGCAVALIVIGPQWFDVHTENGMPRLEAPGDYVRLEVESALALGLTVIPLLVDHAAMPPASSLPASLQRLARLNALQVRNDPDFARDMERVIAALEHAFAAKAKPALFGRRNAPQIAARTIPEGSAHSWPNKSEAPLARGQTSAFGLTAEMQPAPMLPSAANQSNLPAPPSDGASSMPSQVVRGPIQAKSRLNRPLGATLAIVVVVAGFVGTWRLAGFGMPGGAQANRGHVQSTKVPTISPDSVTATAYSRALFPYSQAAPGRPGGQCDDSGVAEWNSSGPGLSCLSNPTRTHAANNAGMIWNYPYYYVGLPESYSVSVQIAHVSLHESASLMILFAVPTGSATIDGVTYRIEVDGDGTFYYIVHDAAPQPGPQRLDLSQATTVKVGVSGRTITCYLNGSPLGSYTEKQPFHLGQIDLSAQYNAWNSVSGDLYPTPTTTPGADFMNFSLA